MRSIIALVLFAALAGCVTLHHQDPQTGLELTYTGGADGAVELVRATDPRAFDLANKAMDEGMSTSLDREADGDVRFNASYGYSAYNTTGATSVGGYAAPNTVYIDGQGFVTSPPGSTLPQLATTVVTGVPPTQTTATGGAIVPCPTGRSPATDAEQAACAYSGVLSLTANRVR